MDDLLLRGATLFDGSGADPFRADRDDATGLRTGGRLAGEVITAFAH